MLMSLMATGFVVGGCQVIPDRGMACPASDVVVTGFHIPPRLRTGFSPCAIMGTDFLGDRLGTHGYYWRLSEKNGMLYTSRGGHIDTTHVRIAADWTAYLTARSYRHLMRGDPSFSYKMLADRSRHTAYLSYPANWRTLPPEQRRQAAREAALTMGPYLAFTMVSWHEMLTWYGFRCVGVVRESYSAFSWEDSYSNLFGTLVAARALRDTKHSYDEAVTIALEQELRALGVQPGSVSKQASESVRGRWYIGRLGPLLRVMKRNCDVGADDGCVTPVLVPGLPGATTVGRVSYRVPTLDALSRYGLSARVEIEPHEWEKGKLLRIVYPDGHAKRIRPATDFAPIQARITQDIIDKYGPGMAGDLPSPIPQNPAVQSRPPLATTRPGTIRPQ